MRGGGPPPPMIQPTATATPALALPPGAVEVTNVVLVCKGVNRGDSTNGQLAFVVQQYLTNSPSFTSPATLRNIPYDEDTNTFTFEVTVNLRQHFKLQ